jgi:hypothetical protein
LLHGGVVLFSTAYRMETSGRWSPSDLTSYFCGVISYPAEIRGS